MSGIQSTSGPGFFASSLGKKYVIGLMAIGITLFAFTHMLGNMLLFVSPKAYNIYSHTLISNPAIVAIELALLAIFLVHVAFTIWTTIENKAARGNRTFLTTKGAKSVSLSSKTMFYHGVVIFFFVAWHLKTFKYGTNYDVTYNGVLMRDIHRLLVEVFQSPFYVWSYVFCVVFLGYHLNHGVQSVFQTLGFNHPKYSPAIRKLGVAYAVVVAVGFILQPLYVYFFMKQ